MLDDQTLSVLAQRLQDARLAGTELPPLSRETLGLDLKDGYEILHRGIALREQAGEKVNAWKMGLTSAAKRKQIKIDSPIYGVLTDRMQLPDGGTMPLAGTIHPKIEPEIAFILKKGLSGNPSREEAAASIGAVHTALEILDSRYMGFKDFLLPDVVADNGSSSHYVLSRDSVPPEGLALDKLQMRFFVNEREVGNAESSEISGHPVESLVQLCQLLSLRGEGLPAGAIVLAGAATAAVLLQPGHYVRLETERLPPVSIRA